MVGWIVRSNKANFKQEWQNEIEHPIQITCKNIINYLPHEKKNDERHKLEREWKININPKSRYNKNKAIWWIGKQKSDNPIIEWGRTDVGRTGWW